jgi:dihydrofolate reductase
MKQERKIIEHIAISADGCIARKDGSWIGSTGRGLEAATAWASVSSPWTRSCGGRKTYEPARKMGHTADRGPKVKNCVFSTTMDGPAPRNVEFVKEPIGAFAKRLRAQPGKGIRMMGGGGIIASFLEAGEIDEFSMHVIPNFIGEGIPLVQPRHRSIPLKLLSAKTFPDGVVHLNYSVARAV